MRDFVSLVEKLTVTQLVTKVPICTALHVIHTTRPIPVTYHFLCKSSYDAFSSHTI
jgi:hypothetical protein